MMTMMMTMGSRGDKISMDLRANGFRTPAIYHMTSQDYFVKFTKTVKFIFKPIILFQLTTFHVMQTL
jgi:hypothetical protein